MTQSASGLPAELAERTRIRVFVDYWNLQLTLNEREGQETGNGDERFKLDWSRLPGWLAAAAASVAGVTNHSYDGAIIYASYDPKTLDGKKFHNWATTWLDRQPGIQVQCRPRRPRQPIKCNHCHQRVLTCPNCQKALSGTVEKGVDTAIATDMIRLAWENAYDIAVLASLDADFIPAVSFLDQKGKKVIQAGFPPKGTDLATACWASFDLFARRNEIRRP